MQIKDLFDFIVLFVIFIGVLFLTYYATKKMAAFNKKMTFNKNMQIIEVLQLGQGQYLYIVQVGGEYHLFGVAKENVSYCVKLDEDKLDLLAKEEKSFHEYFNQFIKGKQVNNDENK